MWVEWGSENARAHRRIFAQPVSSISKERDDEQGEITIMGGTEKLDGDREKHG